MALCFKYLQPKSIAGRIRSGQKVLGSIMYFLEVSATNHLSKVIRTWRASGDLKPSIRLQVILFRLDCHPCCVPLHSLRSEKELKFSSKLISQRADLQLLLSILKRSSIANDVRKRKQWEIVQTGCNVNVMEESIVVILRF